MRTFLPSLASPLDVPALLTFSPWNHGAAGPGPRKFPDSPDVMAGAKDARKYAGITWERTERAAICARRTVFHVFGQPGPVAADVEWAGPAGPKRCRLNAVV